MKAKKVGILVTTALGLIGLLITVGNGCSKRGEFESTLSSTASTGNNDSSSTTTDPDYIPGAKTVSVVYAKQALDQLTSCAGVISPSDDTTRMYDAKKSSISAYGDANSVTAPMMMAIANISGEICDDLIDQEIAGPSRIFVGWNLTSTSKPAANLVADSISRLAISCWQKNESAAESQAVLNLISSVPTGANGARKQALLLCTAMLSSLNSLLN
jgi:hypothetical protein